MKKSALVLLAALIVASHALSAGAADGSPAAVPAAYRSQATWAVLSNVIVPTVLSKGEWVEYRVAARPDGRIDSVHVLRSSGSKQWELATALGLARTVKLPKTSDGGVPASLDLRLESAAAHGL
jgi:hypothetical protein